MEDAAIEWKSRRIPLSTLRSTASPSKQRQDPSPFSTYLSELALTNITSTLVYEEPDSLNLRLKSLSPRHSRTPSPTRSAFDASKSSYSGLDHTELHLYIQTDADDASQVSPTALSSPLIVPSSPSSAAAADISTALDFCQGEDDLTDIDLPECAIIPSSPFSSPLSTAPNSPVAVHVAILRPEADTELSECSEKPKKSRSISRSSEASSGVDATAGSGKKSRKRARSPSPTTDSKSYRRSRVEKKEDKWREALNSKKGLGSKSKLEQLSPRSCKSSDELVGPLAQILALCGKSSMPTSDLVRELLDSTPALRSERTLEEWHALVVMTMATYPIFGQAERKGLKVRPRTMRKNSIL